MAPWERKTWWSSARHDGDDGGSTTVQATEPASFQQPFLERGFRSAESNVLNRPKSFFPGSTVVPFSQESQIGLDAQTDRALSGSPLLDSSQRFTQQLLDDPGSSPLFDAVTNEVRPGIDSAFSRGGRFGSGLQAEALGKGITRGIAPFISQAADRAPQLAREDFFDIGQLRDVGAAREVKAGENLDDSIARFNFRQDEPTNRTADFLRLIGGNFGGTSTQTTRQSTNPFLTGAGLAVSGAQLAQGAGDK